MAQPVWVLSVDLQTKTATFQSGMAEAARSARGAFTDIKSGATEMSGHIGSNMFASRHAIMAVSEAFGDTMPRGITALLVHIGPLGAALEAAFPYAAIGLAAVLIIQHFAKMSEEAQKAKRDQIEFGTAIQNSFNGLDDKLLQAGMRADELRNDHLGALAKQLELLDHESLNELVKSFETVAKAADIVFKDMESHWYTFGIGSSGAKHALENFKVSYDALLSQGKNAEAADLLKGTRESAEKVLAMQQQAKSAMDNQKGKAGTDVEDQIKYSQANNVLKAAGVGYSEAEVKSQQALVQALQAQVGIEGKIAELKNLEKSNDTRATQNKMDEEAQEKARKALEAEKKASEEAKKFYEEAYRSYVTVIDEGEREKIAATKEGTAERLAVIETAIKEEQTEQLTGTSYYRELMTARVTTIRQMAEEELRIRAEAAKEAADNEEKIGELSIAADRERTALIDSARRVSEEQRIAEQINFANRELALKMTALSQEAAALDKSGKDYENKLRQMQDKETQLLLAHENEVAAIQDRAASERNQKYQASMIQMENSAAQGLLSILTGHRSFAQEMSGIMQSLAQNVISAAIQQMNGQAPLLLANAKLAASNVYAQVSAWPVVGPFLAPELAAAAFAGSLAFESGGIVPGVGRGDTVPAMLTPGEAVLPKNITEGLISASRNGGMGGGTHYHVTAHYAPRIQAVDGVGVDRMLNKHGVKFQKHFESTLRKMNH